MTTDHCQEKQVL